jgi:hypothetical protein
VVIASKPRQHIGKRKHHVGERHRLV